MMEPELEALYELNLDPTHAVTSVWASSPFHVDGLHPDAGRRILEGIEEATSRVGDSPRGLVLEGPGGAGKTHLLGWARQRVHEVGGYFFLITINSNESFWDATVNQLREGLNRAVGDSGRSQLSLLIHDLAERADVTSRVVEAVTGERAPSTADLTAFVRAVGRLDSTVALECGDTIRALALLASDRTEDGEIGYNYLSGNELTVQERERAGIRTSRPKDRPRIVTELSRVLALSGPIVLAVDQIDGLIETVEKGKELGARAGLQLVHIANALMQLYDHMHRTFTILSCIPDSWAYLKSKTIATFPARFREPVQLRTLPDVETARAVLRRRLELGFMKAGFTPPYPTWPVQPKALERSTEFTVRGLLRRVEQHVEQCKRAGVVTILESLAEPAFSPEAPEPDVAEIGTTLLGARSTSEERLALWDQRFEQAAAAADLAGPLDPDTEDRVLPDLLEAGLQAWIEERVGDGRHFQVETWTGGKRPALHAQLSEILDDETERKRAWSFRGIAAAHHRAVQSRLQNARHLSGLDQGVPDQYLFLIRNQRYPEGPATDRIRREIAALGAVEVVLTTPDIRTFSALLAMRAERDSSWVAWLRSRRPAHNTELFSFAFGERDRGKDNLGERLPEDDPNAADRQAEEAQQLPLNLEQAGTSSAASSVSPAARSMGSPVQATAVVPESTAEASTVLIGTARNRPVELRLESLRRHLLVVAGPGSGKTVLLRRLIEECALCGVSAIVLDGEGDLARMGDRWPTDPDGWRAGDAERAREYAANVEVVVWTPGKAGGRPLSFRPLPEFPAYGNDGDDFRDAVEVAVASLAPRMLIRENQKGHKEKAVLRECVDFFGREGGTELDDLRDLMQDLPPEATRFSYGPSVAAELAERLEWARVNDPIAAVGAPVDPDRLIMPEGRARARVSIISLVGLSESVQPNFVNQLQLALFSWAQKHPETDGRLRCLVVMDEAQRFIPARGTTTSTDSTLMLAARARKYGLGMIFATQLPKGLRNEVVSNASTQLLGRVGAGASINAVQELARSRGGEISDANALRPGEFYLGVEGQQFHKIRTLMCLSHHAGPLEEDEIMRRARGER